MAKNLIWKIDDNYQVELKFSFPSKTKVLVNGQQVPHTKGALKRSIVFTLEDRREGVIAVAPFGILAVERELRVNGQIVLSQAQLAKIACGKCGKKFKAVDKFCEKCGAELPEAETQLKMVRLKEAGNMIGGLALMFLVFGAVLYFVKANQADESLKKFAKYQDSQVLPEPINGKQYTVGELRKEISEEPIDILVTNAVLAVIMFGLYLYSKKSPLVALITAAAVYGSVNVLNAIIDPKTLGQGLILKIIVIGLFIKGIRSALELRKVDS